MAKKKDNTWLWLLGGAAVLLLLNSNKGVAGSLYASGSRGEPDYQALEPAPIPEVGPYQEQQNIYQANIPTELALMSALPSGSGAWSQADIINYEAQARAIRAANLEMSAVEAYRQARIQSAAGGSALAAVLSAAPAFASAGPAGSVARIAAMRDAGVI